MTDSVDRNNSLLADELEIVFKHKKGNRNYYEKRIFYKVLFPYCSPISNLCDRMRPTLRRRAALIES